LCGIVRFVRGEDRVELEFNLDAADDGKLHMKFKLVVLARTVRRADE
jgi:hypothetical protein